MPATRGDRVGVASSITQTEVAFLGWGVFMGRGPRGPVIRLDDGREVLGQGLWWSDEASMRRLLAKRLVQQADQSVVVLADSPSVPMNVPRDK